MPNTNPINPHQEAILTVIEALLNAIFMMGCLAILVPCLIVVFHLLSSRRP